MLAATKLLIIGGAEADRKNYEQMLMHSYPQRYQILLEHSCANAISHNVAFLPDCILIDFTLLDGDGLKLIAALKQSVNSKPQAIIMLASISSFGLTSKALEIGATNYLMKMHIQHNIKNLNDLILACIAKIKHDHGHQEQDNQHKGDNHSLNITPALEHFHNTQKDIKTELAQSHKDSNLSEGHAHTKQIVQYHMIQSINSNKRNDPKIKNVLEEASADYQASNNHAFINERDVYKNSLSDVETPLSDQITGLESKELFNFILEKNVAQAYAFGKKLALLLVTIRNFEHIKTLLGPQDYHLLLRELACRWKVNLRSIDYISRTANSSEDEFSILLNDLDDYSDVAFLAREMIKILWQPFVIKLQRISIQIDIGISCLSVDAIDALELKRNSLLALQEAKVQKQSTYVFNNREFNTLDYHYQTVIRDLHQALVSSKLYLCYQAVYELKSKNIHMQQSSLHWDHPALEIIGSGELIKIAEKTQFIIPVTHWMIKSSVQQLLTWQNAMPTLQKMIIKISPIALREKNFIDGLQKIVEMLKLNPTNILLMMNDLKQHSRIHVSTIAIKSLHQLGFSVGIDHFGSGTSSIPELLNQAIDCVKIDEKLIHEMVTNNKQAQLVQSIINLGKDLNIAVIANGVETEIQLNLLQKMGCTFAQGNYFSKPLRATEMTHIMLNSSKYKIG